MKRKVEDVFLEIRKWSKIGYSNIRKLRSHLSASANIWNPQVSQNDDKSHSSLSSGVSKISVSSYSVSAVSSDDLTSNSLEEGEIEEKSSSLDCYSVLMSNKFDDFIDLESHITKLKTCVKRISLLNKLILTKTSLLDLYESGLIVLKECQQTTCTVAPILTVLITSKKQVVCIKRIRECFSEQYNAVISLGRGVLSLKGKCGFYCTVLFLPYILDILIATLPSLVESFKESKTWENVVSTLDSLIQSSLLIFCSSVEYIEEEARVNTAKAIFYLLMILVPIQKVQSLMSVDDTTAHCNRDNMKHLIQTVLSEYITDEESFKPSSLILLHLHSNMGIHSKELSKYVSSYSEVVGGIIYDHLNTAIQCGCMKRQFPVGYLDSNNYNLDIVSKACMYSKSKPQGRQDAGKCDDDLTRLWFKVKYWLLLLLEDNNAKVRNVALKIIRHVMMTVPFLEKDRQHVMSLVTDCLSDNTTFSSAMAGLISVSFIYPLKDGAVRKISNITLKGSDIRDRIKVIRFLGECKFSIRGIDAVLNILHTLCEPIRLDDQKSLNARYATSSISDHNSEILFSTFEWPEILKTIRKFKTMAAFKTSKGTDFTGLFNIADTYETSFLKLLLSYMLEREVHWSRFYSFRRSELSIRFPDDIDMEPVPFEREFLSEANAAISTFLCPPKYAMNDEVPKGKALFLHIHRCRIKGSVDALRKLLYLRRKVTNTSVNAEKGKKCRCVDCAMDKMILSSKVKRPVNNVDDSTECTTYISDPQIEHENICTYGIPKEKMQTIFLGTALVGYYHKFPKGIKEEYHSINDINFISFPSHLGSSIVCNVPFHLPQPSKLGICMKNAIFLKTYSKHRKWHSICKDTPSANNITFKLHIKSHLPTLYPTPIEVVPFIHKGNKKLMLGHPKMLWVHGKRTSR